LIKNAEANGVKQENIIIDPGIGFGKTFEHNLEILQNLSYFKALGRPILVGPSRKSFIGNILGVEPSKRIFGTAAAAAIAIKNGADIVRVHDVREMRQVAMVVDSIVRSKEVVNV
ncbi:MAG: dihydropteroate synthase, partial [Candidatus Omnitrophica bacterium]|nr:dihydropteroate synthase [Candidatus Omnitrophota bacterium]